MSFRAFILAGGRGSRLYPFTASLPKPLLPIGDTPVVDLIARRMVAAGADRITVAVNYLADLIESYLGNGRKLGVPIDYVREARPLGTAGPIGLADRWEGPLIVSNGDVLSDIDYGALLAAHYSAGAALTVATKMQTLRIDSGVLSLDEVGRVTGIREKPEVHHRISLGVYVLAPKVFDFIGVDRHLEMPQLMLDLIAQSQTVFAYDHAGLWLDIGRPDDFARAQSDAEILARLEGDKVTRRLGETF